jgi:hypothetical protein
MSNLPSSNLPDRQGDDHGKKATPHKKDGPRHFSRTGIGLAVATGVALAPLWVYRLVVGAFLEQNNVAIAALSGLAVAVFTVVLARIAHLQRQTMDAQERRMSETIEAMNDTAQRQLRAYVSFRELACVLHPNANKPDDPEWEVKAQFRNSGQTPARNTELSLNFELFPKGGLPTDFNFPNHGALGAGVRRGGVLGPECEMSTISLTILHYHADQLRRNPEAELYIWGWITYSDVFPKSERRRTEFASRVIPNGATFISVMLDRHNDAT